MAGTPLWWRSKCNRLGVMTPSGSKPSDEVSRGRYVYRRSVASRLLPDGLLEILLVYETDLDGRLVERVEERSLAGVITRKHVHTLLHDTGYSIRREFSDYDKTAYHEGDSILIVDAQKT